MKTLSITFFGAAMLLCYKNVYAGEVIFSDSANAKVARVKAKIRVMKNANQKSLLSSDQNEKVGEVADNCGSVNVANTKVGQKVKKIDVIVLGDIINTGNNC